MKQPLQIATLCALWSPVFGRPYSTECAVVVSWYMARPGRATPPAAELVSGARIAVAPVPIPAPAVICPIISNSPDAAVSVMVGVVPS